MSQANCEPVYGVDQFPLMPFSDALKLSKDNIEDEVLAFHRKYVPEKIAAHPTALNRICPDELKFRLDFIEEEFTELKEALAEGDSAGELDAYVDMMWVVYGTMLMRFGEHASRDAMRAVFDANMTKVRLPGQFKIQKPEGFKPPDIQAVLDSHLPF